jgi:hypothetical protein
MEELVASVINSKQQLLESYRINRLRGMFSEAGLPGNPHKMGKKELVDHLMVQVTPAIPIPIVTPSVPVQTPGEKESQGIRDDIDTLMRELTIGELRALRDQLQQMMDTPEEVN